VLDVDFAFALELDAGLAEWDLDLGAIDLVVGSNSTKLVYKYEQEYVLLICHILMRKLSMQLVTSETSSVRVIVVMTWEWPQDIYIPDELSRNDHHPWILHNPQNLPVSIVKRF